MVPHAAPHHLFPRASVLAEILQGTGSAFLADSLPGLPIPHKFPFLVLPFGPRWKILYIPLKKSRAFFPLACFWYKPSCRVRPKEHTTRRTAGSGEREQQGPHHPPTS